MSKYLKNKSQKQMNSKLGHLVMVFQIFKDVRQYFKVW